MKQFIKLLCLDLIKQHHILFGKVAAEPVAALLDQVVFICCLSSHNHIVNSGSIARHCAFFTTESIFKDYVLFTIQSIICVFNWDFYFLSFIYYFFHLAAFFISPMSFLIRRNISSIASAILFNCFVSMLYLFLNVSYHLWDWLSSLQLGA